MLKSKSAILTLRRHLLTQTLTAEATHGATVAHSVKQLAKLMARQNLELLSLLCSLCRSAPCQMLVPSPSTRGPAQPPQVGRNDPGELESQPHLTKIPKTDLNS